jgi:putative spermidine/putrescine transport system permease protein
MTSPALKWALRIGSGITLVFLYVPLGLIGLYAFNDSKSVKWPFSGFTTHWLSAAIHNEGARSAFFLSLRVALAAAAVALILGTLLAMAVSRFSFFGRNTVSFIVVLPIALPGIVTGLALNQTFVNVIVAHATFCIVIVYNNVAARLRRMSGSLEEASSDLGASTLQTFRHVTFPLMRSAILAGALLAIALSFDEIIVTTFTLGATQSQTLPIWIFSNISRPNQLPIVYAVALIVIVLSAIPVYIAQRLAGDAAGGGRT